MPQSRSKGVDLVKVSALLTLMAATCWVVASLVSVWLVPPYLVVMALILFPSTATTRRRLEANRLELAATSASTWADRGRSHREGEGVESEAINSSERSSTLTGGPSAERATASIADGETSPTPATAKPKRGRSRPRKVTRPTAEATEVVPATWVEVGPGKFVRVESPTGPAPVAEPHAAVESTPEPLPIHDDPIARESESLENQWEPAGSFPVVEPGSSLVSDANLRLESRILSNDVHPTSDSITADLNQVTHRSALGSVVLPVQAVPREENLQGPDPNTPTVDGITPQVAGDEVPVLESNLFFEPAEADPEPGLDRVECWPSTEPVEPFVSPELDPGEICDESVDRTIPRERFDDQVEARTENEVNRVLGAIVAWPQDFKPKDPSFYVDQDVSTGIAAAFEAAPDVEHGGWCSRRSFPLAPVVRRCRGGGAPRGRFGRPTRSNRRPINSRRPSRRRVGRPRQITRTSPPRSPPSSRLSRSWRRSPGFSLQCRPRIGST